MVGRRVAELRVAQGMTQEALAEATGFYARYVQTIEAGRANLRLDSLARLATALRVPVTELFTAPSPARGRLKRRQRR